MNELKKLDREFTTFVEKNLLNEPYTFLIPTNKEEEEERFYEYFFDKKKYEPQFSYNQTNVEEYLIKLDYFHFEFLKIKNKYLRNLYLKKIKELSYFVRLIENCSQKDFSKISIKAYGRPNLFIFIIAKFVTYFRNEITHRRIMSEEDIKFLFNDYCFQNDLKGWKLRFSKSIFSIAFIICSKKKLFFNKNLKYTEQDVIRLLRHELGTHAKRYMNGNEISGLFSLGLSRYDELEEGLATFSEDGLKNFFDVGYLPALKYLAVFYALKYDFTETFRRIYSIAQNRKMAFDIVLRAKRGTYNNSGAYTKDYLYFSGYVKVILLSFFNKRILKDALIGKIAFSNLKEINKINNLKSYYE